MTGSRDIKRDAAFDSAVRQLRHAPEGYAPPLPDFSGSRLLPDKARTQRIRWLAARIPTGSRVLDLGCGRGEVLHFLTRDLRIEYLGLEREPAFREECRRIGVRAIAADFNDLNDPALRHACSQRWDVVLIIDSINYWRYPAVVLAALQDRCQRIFVTIVNAAHVRRRLQCLAGTALELPNVRGSAAAGAAEFTTNWFVNGWTMSSFEHWCAALGYRAAAVARRQVNAEYRPLRPLPGLFDRCVVYELSPI